MTAYITRLNTTDTEDSLFIKYLCGDTLPMTKYLGAKQIDATSNGGVTEQVVLYTVGEEALHTLTITLGFDNPAELMTIEELEV